MPLVMRCYDAALEASTSPRLKAIMVHATIAATNLSLVASLSLVLPTAMPLRPALDVGLQVLPRDGAQFFSLICFGLFVPVSYTHLTLRTKRIV